MNCHTVAVLIALLGGRTIAEDARISREVVRLFGTIDEPAFWDVSVAGLDARPTRADVWSLVRGRRAYLVACAKCHGEHGDGRGESDVARDFGDGFHWTSTGVGGPPLLHDIAETIRLGSPGTRMPAHTMLSESERYDLARYVRWLAWRRESGRRIERFVEREDLLPGEEVDRELTTEVVRVAILRWQSPKVLRPGAMPKTASSVRGRELFAGKLSCVVCHGDEGRGDGRATKAVGRNPRTRKPYDEPGLRDLRGRLTKPRDLTAGLYRGGAGDADLFCRIRGGITGTLMPGHSPRLTDAEVWDVVAYVRSLAEETDPRNVVRRPPPTDDQLAETVVPRGSKPQPVEPMPPRPTVSDAIGKLRGRVVFTGAIPKPAVIQAKARRTGLTADVYDESLVVDAETRGLANVFVYLPRAPANAAVPKPGKRPLVFDVSMARSVPRAVVVRVGEPITVKTTGIMVVNVHTLPKRAAVYNKAFRPGSEDELVYDRAEREPVLVKDDIHFWKKAYHLPLDHPFAAVTDASGRFAIEGLPAGEHEFVVWHERTGTSQLVVAIEEDRETLVEHRLSLPAKE